MPDNFNLCQQVPTSVLTDNNTGFAIPVWLNWFNSVVRLLRKAPYSYNGITAPLIEPSKIGDLYIDTNARKVYCAVGLTSADWVILN